MVYTIAIAVFIPWTPLTVLVYTYYCRRVRTCMCVHTCVREMVRACPYYGSAAVEAGERNEPEVLLPTERWPPRCKRAALQHAPPQCQIKPRVEPGPRQ